MGDHSAFLFIVFIFNTFKLMLAVSTLQLQMIPQLSINHLIYEIPENCENPHYNFPEPEVTSSSIRYTVCNYIKQRKAANPWHHIGETGTRNDLLSINV